LGAQEVFEWSELEPNMFGSINGYDHANQKASKFDEGQETIATAISFRRRIFSIHHFCPTSQ